MEIVNLAAYKFVSITDPNSFRPCVKTRCQELGVMGSILFSPEGINFFVAGERSGIDAFIDFIRHDAMFEGRFTDITIKESISDHQPHKRIVVRLKNEIITMKHQTIVKPTDDRAPAVEPITLKKWLDQGHDDEGRELVLLDTRNDFEVKIGTFDNSIQLGIETFSEFPEAFNNTAGDTKQDFQGKTIVSFCTGGIRCEKAALFMQENNIQHVYQLDGGILKYFEEVGGAHWNGECFVFDRRIALDPDLNPTKNHYEVTAKPSRMEQYYQWKEKKEREEKVRMESQPAGHDTSEA